jgi:hypothetical protein
MAGPVRHDLDLLTIKGTREHLESAVAELTCFEPSAGRQSVPGRQP